MGDRCYLEISKGIGAHEGVLQLGGHACGQAGGGPVVQLLLLLKGVALLREGRLWKARKLLLSREAALKEATTLSSCQSWVIAPSTRASTATSICSTT